MPRNTPNLALRVWDALMDRFNHVELSQNWDKIDAHDHTGGGKGLPIPVGGLAPGAVNNLAIQDSAVSTAKIENAGVTEQKIALQAVNTGNIKNSAVTSDKLANSSVSTEKIAPQAVTSAKIADLAVGTGQIANNAITAAKIPDASIKATKLRPYTTLGYSDTVIPVNGIIGSSYTEVCSTNFTHTVGEFMMYIVTYGFVMRDMADDEFAAQVSFDGPPGFSIPNFGARVATGNSPYLAVTKFSKKDQWIVPAAQFDSAPGAHEVSLYMWCDGSGGPDVSSAMVYIQGFC